MTVVYAVAAAFVFGGGVALQQHAATAVPHEHSLRLGLLARLLRRPMWVAGVVAEVAGFALQVAALSNGSLVVVQPILTVDLVFTLAIAAAWSHERLRTREWLGVGCTVVGVASFLVVVGADQESRAVAGAGTWLLCAAWVVALAGAAAWAALQAVGPRRAALLGMAAGAANGFMAVLAKAFADKLDDGLGETLASWQLYALVTAGVATLLLVQSTYQAGHPTLSLPVMNVADPVVSVAIGVAVFGERVSLGGGNGVLVVLAMIAMVGGLVALARAPLVVGSGTVPTHAVGAP